MSYQDYINSSSYYEEEMLIAGLIVIAVACVVALITWLITLYPRYYMVKASGVGPVWTAFIPIWQDIQFFKMAGWPGWSYWVYLIGFSIANCIPFLNIFSYIGMFVFLCILYWRVSTNFGLGTCGKILSLFLGYWVYWYVAIVKKPYVPVYGMYTQPQQYNNNQNWYQNGGQQPQDNTWYQQTNQNAQPQQNWQQPNPQAQSQNDWYQQNNNTPQQ